MKWRYVLTILPTWPIGVSFFAIAAFVLNNWWHLHLAYAIVSAPSLLGWFFVPESVRWLALKGKVKEGFRANIRDQWQRFTARCELNTPSNIRDRIKAKGKQQEIHVS